MVKSKPNNRAKGARRARRTPRKNIQKQNQNASRRQIGGRSGLMAANSEKGLLPRRIGVSDVMAHTMTWLAGYTYVGNGTLGATDSVYFVDPTSTHTVVPVSGLSVNGNVPIAPGDSLVGAAYAADILKHYARLRVRGLECELESLHPSTSNDMTAVIAPLAGAAGIGATNTSTTAGNSYTNVISMTGKQQVAAWESARMNWSSFIAGGSGAKQNEFQIEDFFANNAIFGTMAEAGEIGVVPAMFAVSGNSATTALRGSNVHAIIFTMIVDLLDYIGGDSATDPVGVSSRVAKSLLTRVPAAHRLKRSQTAATSSTDSLDITPEEAVRFRQLLKTMQ